MLKGLRSSHIVFWTTIFLLTTGILSLANAQSGEETEQSAEQKLLDGLWEGRNGKIVRITHEDNSVEAVVFKSPKGSRVKVGHVYFRGTLKEGNILEGEILTVMRPEHDPEGTDPGTWTRIVKDPEQEPAIARKFFVDSVFTKSDAIWVFDQFLGEASVSPLWTNVIKDVYAVGGEDEYGREKLVHWDREVTMKQNKDGKTKTTKEENIWEQYIYGEGGHQKLTTFDTSGSLSVRIGLGQDVSETADFRFSRASNEAGLNAKVYLIVANHNLTEHEPFYRNMVEINKSPFDRAFVYESESDFRFRGVWQKNTVLQVEVGTIFFPSAVNLIKSGKINLSAKEIGWKIVEMVKERLEGIEFVELSSAK